MKEKDECVLLTDTWDRCEVAHETTTIVTHEEVSEAMVQ